MTGKHAIPFLGLIAFCSCAMAADDIRIVIDPPDLKSELATKIKSDWDWKREVFCFSFEVRYLGIEPLIFGRRYVRWTGDPRQLDRAEALTKLGLLERVPTNDNLRTLQGVDDGAWYRITPYGRNNGVGAGSCFGTRSFLRVNTIKPPEYSAYFGWQREVVYDYEVSGMPSFTQMPAFREVFGNVPANGEVRTQTVTFGLAWEPEWVYVNRSYPD